MWCELYGDGFENGTWCVFYLNNTTTNHLLLIAGMEVQCNLEIDLVDCSKFIYLNRRFESFPYILGFDQLLWHHAHGVV